MSHRSWDKSQNASGPLHGTTLPRTVTVGAGHLEPPQSSAGPPLFPAPELEAEEKRQRRRVWMSIHAPVSVLLSPCTHLPLLSTRLQGSSWLGRRLVAGAFPTVSSPDRHLCPESQTRVKAHRTERALPRRGPARGPPPSVPEVRRLLPPSLFAEDNASLGVGGL